MGSNGATRGRGQSGFALHPQRMAMRGSVAREGSTAEWVHRADRAGRLRLGDLLRLELDLLRRPPDTEVRTCQWGNRGTFTTSTSCNGKPQWTATMASGEAEYRPLAEFLALPRTKLAQSANSRQDCVLGPLVSSAFKLL